MHLSGTIELKTDDGEMSFTQDITFVITEMRPLFDGKPGSEEADRSRMNVTLMSPDSLIRVYEIDITTEEREVYLKLLDIHELNGLVLVG